MIIKTVKQIVEDSFKNQEFNQVQSYPEVTTVFDTLQWIEEHNDRYDRYVKLDDINSRLLDCFNSDLEQCSITKLHKLMCDLSDVRSVK